MVFNDKGLTMTMAFNDETSIMTMMITMMAHLQWLMIN